MERVIDQTLMSLLRKGSITYSEDLASPWCLARESQNILDWVTDSNEPGWAYIFRIITHSIMVRKTAQRNDHQWFQAESTIFLKNYSQEFKRQTQPGTDGGLNVNIEMSLNKTFKNYLVFKDDGNGNGFKHLTPTEVGTFNISLWELIHYFIITAVIVFYVWA